VRCLVFRVDGGLSHCQMSPKECLNMEFVVSNQSFYYVNRTVALIRINSWKEIIL
jgi:hypothetical protein